MTTAPEGLRQRRSPSPALLRSGGPLELSDVSIRRRIGWIWGLMFLNVLTYTTKSTLVPLPLTAGKVLTQGALVVAVLLALSINRKVLVRPNVFLILMSLLCVTSLMMSVRGYFGLGSVIRAARLIEMVSVLWLLTPWWGRRDLLFLRCHRRALGVILIVVGIGAIAFHHAAFDQAGGDRLGGAIWPVAPTQVAQFAAILAGTTIVLWFADLIRPRTAGIVTGLSMIALVMTHTRTAMVALFVGVLVAGVSLFISRKRVRKTLAITVIVGALAALCFAPFLSSWFLRGESQSDFYSFTGRANAWAQVLEQPRTEVNTIFGYGMSNDSINGLPIDSSWYASYLDQGLFGDAVDGAVIVLLLVIAVMSPRGPRRAIALFLVVYCVIESVTQTGLGEASTDLLNLAVVMSVLMAPLTGPAEPLPLSGPPPTLSS